MRAVTLTAAAAFAVLTPYALAQNETPKVAPAGTPPTPYSTGPLPAEDSGPGLDKVGPDGSTKTVKAVPCSTAARETDGSTTCVGIPDESARAKKNGYKKTAEGGLIDRAPACAVPNDALCDRD
jgi:hypothetical protein